MKKVVIMFALVAFLFSMNTNAQEPKAKKKVAKTEKAAACSKEEKKACASGEKKGCCAHKEEAK